MKVNTWLLTIQGQIGIAMSLILMLFLMVWVAPSFVTPIILSVLPVVFYIVVYKTSLLTIVLFSLLFFRIQELIPALQPFRVVLVFFLLLCISFPINLFFKRIKLYWSPEMTNFLVFFILVSMGVFLSYDFSMSYINWSEGFLKISILFFIIAWTLTNKNDFLKIIGVMIVGGFILSVITLYNDINAIGLVEKSRATLGGNQGMLGDPNDLALNLLIPFSFSACITFSTYSSPKYRILGLIISLIILCAIVATKSRGGLIGLSVVFLYFFYSRIKSKSFLIFIGIALLAMLYVIAGISNRESGGGLDVSALNRIAAWKAAINMSIHHPIFGVGLGQFANNFYNYAPSDVISNPLLRTNLVAHSIWFSVLAESGFVGLSLFIICIHAAFKSNQSVISKLKLLSDKKKEYQTYLIFAYSLYGGLIGYCVAGTFLAQGFTGIFYFLFALSISLAHVVQENISMSIERNDENT